MDQCVKKFMIIIINYILYIIYSYVIYTVYNIYYVLYIIWSTHFLRGYGTLARQTME